MNRDSWYSKSIFLPLLLAEVLVLGAMVPTFYDWSGADQSRSSPYVPTAFCTIIGCAILAWLILPWLPRRKSEDETRNLSEVPDQRNKFQFKLRSLIVITALIAIVVAGLTSFRLITAIWLISICFFISAWFVMHDLGLRWKCLALVGCMYFPFAWIVLPDNIGDFEVEQVFAALGLPTFLPSIFLGRILGFRMDENIWLFISIVGIEIAVGAWMMRLGPRRGIAWLVFVLILSFVGSCILNAAVRV